MNDFLDAPHVAMGTRDDAEFPLLSFRYLIKMAKFLTSKTSGPLEDYRGDLSLTCKSAYVFLNAAGSSASFAPASSIHVTSIRVIGSAGTIFDSWNEADNEQELREVK
jgi:hypothetical protein